MQPNESIQSSCGGELTVAFCKAPYQKIQAFETSIDAFSHLRNHVLSAPECLAWLLVAPELAYITDLSDEDFRWATTREIMEGDFRDPDNTGVKLMTHWLAEISRASLSAAKLGWVADSGSVSGVATGSGESQTKEEACDDQESSVVVAMDYRGVFLLFQGLLKTAYLPGQGSAEVVRASNLQGATLGWLPRDRKGMRRESHKSNATSGEHRKEVARIAEKRDNWPWEKRLYYDVSRPAFQFVRKSHLLNRSMNGGEQSRRGSRRRRSVSGRRGTIVRDIARLKEVLPSMSRLGFEDWLKLKQTLQVGEN